MVSASGASFVWAGIGTFLAAKGDKVQVSASGASFVWAGIGTFLAAKGDKVQVRLNHPSVPFQ